MSGTRIQQANVIVDIHANSLSIKAIIMTGIVYINHLKLLHMHISIRYHDAAFNILKEQPLKPAPATKYYQHS